MLSPSVRPYWVLAIGVLAVSSSAILITLAREQGVPALTIAALRLTLAALVLGPLGLMRSREEWQHLTAREALLAIASGVLLAFHFAFWISSLDYTSVMSSLVLVSTNPFFVALASVLILREALRTFTAIGIVVAILGGVLIGLADWQGGVGTLQGDALALGGAVAVSGYLLIGRSLRRRLSLLAYVGIVYATAAVVLLGLAAAMGAPLTGYTWQGYVLVLLLAIGPQLIGHSAYNWALKYVSATFVTITILAEPIGATLLAIPILAQVPSPVKVLGGLLVLVGIALAARAESRAELSEAAGAAAEV